MRYIQNTVFMCNFQIVGEEMKRLISIVIPCYRSENTITNVVNEIYEKLSNKISFEVILINDGSPDNVWNKIEELALKYPTIVRGICFSKNFGQHAAILAGYRESKGDFVVQMDDDGQMDPGQIITLIEKIDEGFDIVFARYPQIMQSPFRRFGSYVNKRMCEALIGKPKDVETSTFCIIRRFVVDEMIKYEHSYPYLAGLMFRATRNVADVEIPQRSRTEGNSTYTLKKLLRLWINGFTAFSVKPLELGIFVGVVIAICGFLFALVIIIRKLLGYDVMVGWSSIISLMLILGGMNLVMLGLVGEYIGRVYISINNTPQYVIKSIVGDFSREE